MSTVESNSRPAPRTTARRVLGRRQNGGSNTLQQIAPNRRQIAVTSFDLLNGAYQVSARNRRIAFLLLSVVLISVFWQGGHAVQNNLKLGDLTKENISLKERQRTATTKFSSTTGLPEGVTESQLLVRYDKLTGELKKVSISFTDPISTLATLNDGSVVITAVTSTVYNEITAESDTTSNDRNRAEAKPSKDAKQPIPTELLAGIKKLEDGQVAIVTGITATANDIASLTDWAQRVRDSKYFNNILIERTGNVYTVTGLSLQDRTPAIINNVWNQASLPLASGIRQEEPEKVSGVSPAPSPSATTSTKAVSP